MRIGRSLSGSERSKYYQDQSTTDRYYLDVGDHQKHYHDLLQENVYLKKNLQSHAYLQPYCCYDTNCPQISPLHLFPSYESEITYRSNLDRNQYLSKKVGSLKDQYYQQVNGINKLTHSKKWRQRSNCEKFNCYEYKYLQLLRARSPIE